MIAAVCGTAASISNHLMVLYELVASCHNTGDIHVAAFHAPRRQQHLFEGSHGTNCNAKGRCTVLLQQLTVWSQ